MDKKNLIIGAILGICLPLLGIFIFLKISIGFESSDSNKGSCKYYDTCNPWELTNLLGHLVWFVLLHKIKL